MRGITRNDPHSTARRNPFVNGKEENMNIIDHLKQVSVSTATWHCRAGLIPMLAVVLLSPMAFALEPPPGGAYPGETTALGEDALLNFNTGITGLNTAIGYQALYNDTTGSSNTGVGSHALHDNTEGGGNTAVGYQALYGNTTGDFNVAIDNNAMVANTTALEGTAVGFRRLFHLRVASGGLLHRARSQHDRLPKHGYRLRCYGNEHRSI